MYWSPENVKKVSVPGRKRFVVKRRVCLHVNMIVFLGPVLKLTVSKTWSSRILPSVAIYFLIKKDRVLLAVRKWSESKESLG